MRALAESTIGWTLQTKSNISSFLSPLHLFLVIAKPTLPEVSGPSQRASPGQVIKLTCRSSGFFPRNVSLKWFGTEVSIQEINQNIEPLIGPSGNASSYSISSTIQVILDISSLHSQITCQVDHSELQMPLSTHVSISKFFRGKDPSTPTHVQPALASKGLSHELCTLLNTSLPPQFYLVDSNLPSENE